MASRLEATFCVEGGLGFNRLTPFLSCTDVRSAMIALWKSHGSLNALVDRRQMEAADGETVECGSALWARMCTSMAEHHDFVHEWAIFAATAEGAADYFNEHVRDDSRHPALLLEPAACSFSSQMICSAASVRQYLLDSCKADGKVFGELLIQFGCVSAKRVKAILRSAADAEEAVELLEEELLEDPMLNAVCLVHREVESAAIFARFALNAKHLVDIFSLVDLSEKNQLVVMLTHHRASMLEVSPPLYDCP